MMIDLFLEQNPKIFALTNKKISHGEKKRVIFERNKYMDSIALIQSIYDIHAF